MAVRVLSFDFDGCLFHSGYLHSTEKHVILHNLKFLKTIREQNKDFEQVFLFIGSNRQSLSTDVFNSKVSGSCFLAIQQIANHLSDEEQSIVFDPFLLTDVYNHLESGTAYYRAVDYLRSAAPRLTQIKLKRETPGWVFDDSKVTILYAQIHKAATAHPDKPIVFDFYDNRIDILTDLKIFFEAHPDLIPLNVSLELHQYEGHSITHFAKISGIGLIDIDYSSTVLEISRLAVGGDRYPTRQDHINAAYINPRKLPKRTLIAPIFAVKSTVALSDTRNYEQLAFEPKDAISSREEIPKLHFSRDVLKTPSRLEHTAKKSAEKKRNPSTPLFSELAWTAPEKDEAGLTSSERLEMEDLDGSIQLIDLFFSEKKQKVDATICPSPIGPRLN